MKVVGTVTGNKRLLRKLESYEQAPSLLMQRLNKAGLVIHGFARENIQKVSSGEKVFRYSLPRGKRRVTVSKPGDPPNTDTGQAIKSVGISSDKVRQIVKVGTNLKYLAALEFDSKQNSRKARPWLRPAFKRFMEKHGGKFFKFAFPKAR